MTRVGVALVLLAAALAVPVAVLVARALASAAIEEESRHRLIAERAFDEMESTLSRFLAEEEARPFDAWRFYPSGAPPDRSPLAGGPAAPFVLGYFQIDPDGSLHTPQIPRDPDAAVARGDYRVDPRSLDLIATLEDAWRNAEAPRARPLRDRATSGDQDGLAGLQLERGAPPDAETWPMAPSPDPAEASRAPARETTQEAMEEATKNEKQELDSYSLARSFNLAQKRRQERQPKLARVPEAALAVPPGRTARAPAAPALAPGRAQAAVGRSRADEARTVRVAVDPMLGRAVPGDRLLLVRTAVAGDQAYRQGLLVDWRALGDWLRAEVIDASGLGRADVAARFFPAGSPPASPPASPGVAYRYHHRFAEPFDAFGVALGLPQLPGGRGTGTIHALALLLAGVTAVGLFAVYRMVAVVVQFAERRSRFAASVSHELKTPLTSIRMYAEMLRDGLVPSEAKRAEYYHTITDESERLSRLIDNVLEFSRIERGESPSSVSRADPRPIVAEAVEKLRPHAARQGFRVSFEEDAGPRTGELEAAFDRDALVQVVFNAVDNALKYACDAERREIRVRCRAEERDVVISVRDYGPGVPPEELTRIFEPFYRRDDERTRATRGTGIGLALVRELVASFGGSVSASNADGGGLCVRMRLPRAGAS